MPEQGQFLKKIIWEQEEIDSILSEAISAYTSSEMERWHADLGRLIGGDSSLWKRLPKPEVSKAQARKSLPLIQPAKNNILDIVEI